MTNSLSVEKAREIIADLKKDENIEGHVAVLRWIEIDKKILKKCKLEEALARHAYHEQFSRVIQAILMRLFDISREDVKKELEKYAAKEKAIKMDKVDKKSISKDQKSGDKEVKGIQQEKINKAKDSNAEKESKKDRKEKPKKESSSSSSSVKEVVSKKELSKEDIKKAKEVKKIEKVKKEKSNPVKENDFRRPLVKVDINKTVEKRDKKNVVPAPGPVPSFTVSQKKRKSEESEDLVVKRRREEEKLVMKCKDVKEVEKMEQEKATGHQEQTRELSFEEEFTMF